jgi:hypothetical protein
LESWTSLLLRPGWWACRAARGYAATIRVRAARSAFAKSCHRVTALSVLGVTVRSDLTARHRAVRPAAGAIALRRQRYPAALADGDFDLDIAPRLSSIQRNNNSINVMAQDRPLGVSEDDEAILRPAKFCWYRMFLSAVTSISKAAASAASSQAPFPSLSHPRSIASTTT